MRASLFVLAAAFTVVACSHVVPDADQPAVIVDPTDASRAALQTAVNTEVDSVVMLADDALTETSVLTIERRIPKSVTGSPAQGRTTEPPVRFDLYTNGSDCVLVGSKTSSRYLLADTDCRPL
jgi:hypothetical protein